MRRSITKSCASPRRAEPACGWSCPGPAPVDLAVPGEIDFWGGPASLLLCSRVGVDTGERRRFPAAVAKRRRDVCLSVATSRYLLVDDMSFD